MKVILASNGAEILVDDADFPAMQAHKWRIDRKGYARTNIRPVPDGPQKTVFMHRMLLGVLGSSRIYVDHRDMNPLNNTRANIRLCTPSENVCNRPAMRTNKTGFKGVSRLPNGRFQAQIKAGPTKLYLGSFATPEEAHAAYRQAADTYHGEFANHSRAASQAAEERT
ncbi:pathogenesis-related transcriptional factor and ERF protein [Pandoraea captiosa]|uniref:Pathogenesis-related transcriptional factor and ERF protein n=1 Tax=Pandoraea captiosa TaxID=2508302 RepID=A0A5E5AV39_9BURK|nr:AP2 domain-containing protein [Pandoraea captiosa]VVE76535.1 pathogenesis-related transcriptional factor and ERF protein [Pandoraea captiosa]